MTGGKYNGIKIGAFSKDKENFWFTHNCRSGPIIFVRHSESSIRRVVKDLGLSWATVYRDKDYWSLWNNLTQAWDYKPRY